MPDVKATTAVSAPGKVLLAGGYLVLDRDYTGLVYGLSARISVVAQPIQTSAGVQLSEIVVTSPQFLDAQWRYGYHLAPDDGGIKVTQLQVGSNINPNPFVETTLGYALTYIAGISDQQPAHSFDPSRLTILADNDYYSQPHSEGGEPASQPAAAARFAKFPTTLKGANKTGLGSSAALVTALTASLLAYYLPRDKFDGATEAGRRVLHNLAQAAHCAAQGKVGSGFDVAAAVYGSCRYRRFSPSVLAALPEASAPGFGPALVGCVDGGAWDTDVSKDGVSVPQGLALRMCDVDCGSQTVGMVKQVLAWRAAQPEAARKLWDDLQARNEALGAALQQDRPEPEIAAAVAAVREHIRAMGAESGVPIEPEGQTALLDALTDGVEGVYGGVVPGAGGFDALALVVRDDPATEARVREFVAAWGRERGGTVRLLAVKGEMEGARAEPLDQYEGWI